MTLKKLAAALAVPLLLAGCQAPAAPTPTIGPKGWWVGETHAGAYLGDVDPTTRYEGAASATLRALAERPRPDAWAALTQNADAAAFRGQRVRFSAMVRTRGVADWAGLWLRVDGQDRHISLDNMHDRPIEGDTEWTRHECVLEVPSKATGLAYGLTLSGGGQAWIDDVKLERVGPEVPTTLDPEFTGAHLEPFNTGFELMEVIR